ncbi:hypothetical protein RRG08_004457 [Elysia crispata]|uniref:Uncharacterized protein n=1 Tax=Elysia crispata TaxID=231223 RepID=A0AAE1E611_9GAST|nr:hypothetical protein RRG08_004457 [Elysia crispata]
MPLFHFGWNGVYIMNKFFLRDSNAMSCLGPHDHCVDKPWSIVEDPNSRAVDPNSKGLTITPPALSCHIERKRKI